MLNTVSPTTKATVNSCSGTAQTVYVVTSEYADAIGGGLNVAKSTYFRNPAWKNADVEDFVIDMDFYMVAGTKGIFATQITGTKLDDGAIRYMQPFKITANGTIGQGDICEQ